MYRTSRYIRTLRVAAWIVLCVAAGLVGAGCDFSSSGPVDDTSDRYRPALDDVFNDELPLAPHPDSLFCERAQFIVNVPGGPEPDPSIETETGCGLRLTESVESQTMAVYLREPLALADDASFKTRFRFRIHDAGGTEDGDGPGADGFVFVLQSASVQALGPGGGFLGYAGIPWSVAVEFDTYSNHGLHAGDRYINDPDGNHVGINVEGFPGSPETAGVPARLNDGAVRWVWIDYDGSTDELSVRLSESEARPEDALVTAEIDVPAVLGGTAAWIGFTGATGGGFQTHDVLSWQFESGGQSIAGDESSRGGS